MSGAASGEPVAEPGPSAAAADAQGAEEGEEEEECGWCKWMKAGGCKAEFQVWLDCVDEVKAAGRDDVETCASIMGPLWECMQVHKDYYAPQLASAKDRKGDTAAGGEAEGQGKEGEDDMPGPEQEAAAAAAEREGEGETVSGAAPAALGGAAAAAAAAGASGR